MDISKALMVFFAGGLGSLLRYSVSVAYTKAGLTSWPFNTFTVNVVGGFCMGVLVSWLALRGGADQERWRILIGVGLLGGFTTFSAFSADAVLMIQHKAYGTAAGYIGLSVVLAISALFAGLYVARQVFA
jgi:CrcB protein